MNGFFDDPKRSRLLAKLAVSTIAVIALAIHLMPGGKELNASALALILLAVLPWLASILTRAELPGGWKVEFQAVKSEQHRQAREIDALKFLLSNFLTESELKHLQALASDRSYLVKEDATTFFFQNELRRMRAVGFIAGHPGRGVRSLLDSMRAAGGKDADVKEHFEITPRGLDYLRLLESTSDATDEKGAT